MKLPKGVIIRVNNRTYRGEIPDKLVTDDMRTAIEKKPKSKKHDFSIPGKNKEGEKGK